jgi:hypothetical protein
MRGRRRGEESDRERGEREVRKESEEGRSEGEGWVVLIYDK